MQYKTIVLELLKERTELHEQLRLTRRLLPTMESCATGTEGQPRRLDGDTCRQTNPGSDPSQIASEALELALKELEDRLPSVSPPDDREAAFTRPGDGFRPQSFAEKVRTADQPSLFDSPRTVHHRYTPPTRRRCDQPSGT